MDIWVIRCEDMAMRPGHADLGDVKAWTQEDFTVTVSGFLVCEDEDQITICQGFLGDGSAMNSVRIPQKHILDITCFNLDTLEVIHEVERPVS